MIYTPSQYCKTFLIGNKKVSAETIRRRIRKGLLPSSHKINKIPGKYGAYIIEVPE